MPQNVHRNCKIKKIDYAHEQHLVLFFSEYLLNFLTDLASESNPYILYYILLYSIRNLLLNYPDKRYICNDNDNLLIKTFRAIQDDKQFEKLIDFYKSFEIKIKNKMMILKERTV